MSFKFVRILWGDLTAGEFKKFAILSAVLAIIIGNYNMTRALKDALLSSLVGFEWQPWAKIISVTVAVFVVMGYAKLVDLYARHKLFYIICSFYSILFLILSFFAAHPNLLSIPPKSIFYPLFSWIPGKALGWICYVSIESSSILVALFWAFLASTTKVESAKRGYGMIFFFTQIGHILGAYIVVRYAQTVGTPLLLTLGGFLILLVPPIIRYYIKIIPEEEIYPHPSVAKKEKTGFAQGLKLLVSKPYVMGIFVVATSYEIVGIILEFQMKMIASKHLLRDNFAVFVAKYGIGVGIISLTYALLGTSFFMRKFGLRFCLISYPTLIGFLVGSVFMFRSFGITDYSYMWILFGAMIAIKGLNYALNNPTKEVMYIPTSRDIKFKAKSWIDVFGNRSTKGIGSGITTFFRTSLPDLLMYGTLISLGVVGLWIMIASLLGRSFDKLQKENRIIE